MHIFLLILLVIIIILAFASIKVVKQSEVYIIERLGKFHKAADAGLTIIIPFVDRVSSVVLLKEQTMDIPPQGVITKDNVTINIDIVVFYQITDPVKAVYEIQNLKKGVEYLKWGCRVNRVEVQNINPPEDIREAMEKQMNAERNKRALILEAEAQKQSDITVAQGKKEAAILEAEAESESRIRRATGEANAIKQVAEAKAKEIEMVYDAMMKANPDEKVVQLKSLEALKDIANGESNKVFIPFDATSALGALGAAKEILKDDKKNDNK